MDRYELNFLTSNLPPITLIFISSLLLSLMIPISESRVVYEFSSLTPVFIALIIISSSILLIIVYRLLKQQMMRWLYGSMIGLVSIDLILEIVETTSGIQTILLIILIIIISVVLSAVYVSGQPWIKLRNTGILYASIILGRQVTLLIDVQTILLASFIFSLFDIYSVFWGPLSKVLGKPKSLPFQIPTDSQVAYQLEQVCLKGTPVYISKYSLLGIGDTLFFSILLFVSYQMGFLVMILVVFMLYLGSTLTLFLLRKISPLPALPIPVLSALLVIVLHL
ncbi:MAG: hypothetical protein INQ03_13970 [Candidatus Heimdallarchaeota archaeon]|nr:hypothetical protein [Candidatus Heimdallarchaeota archaeon]